MDFNQGQVREHETVTPNTPSDGFSAGNPIFVEGLLLSSAFFLAASWVLVLLARLDWLKALESRTNPVKKYHQSPCSNCKFFKNNPYLKCAVNPTSVLTEEAKNCPDYSPSERRKRIFR